MSLHPIRDTTGLHHEEVSQRAPVQNPQTNSTSSSSSSDTTTAQQCSSVARTALDAAVTSPSSSSSSLASAIPSRERKFERLLRSWKSLHAELHAILPTLGNEEEAGYRLRLEHRCYLEYKDILCEIKQLLASMTLTEYQQMIQRLKDRSPDLHPIIADVDVHLRHDMHPAHYQRGSLEIIAPARPEGFDSGPEALDEIVTRFSSILQKTPVHKEFATIEALRRNFGSEFSVAHDTSPVAYCEQLIQSLQNCINRIRSRSPVVGVPTNETARQAFYREKENMLLHVLLKVRLLDPGSPEAVQLTINFLKILIINSGHCGIALDLAVVECYKQICLNHNPTTPEERIYNELVEYRRMIVDSYLPPAHRETVVYVREVLRHLGQEFGLQGAHRIHEQDEQGIDRFLSSAPTVDIQRDRVRFGGYYNPTTIVNWMTAIVRQDPELQALCIQHCTPPDTWTTDEIEERRALLAYAQRSGNALHLKNCSILCEDGRSVDAALAALAQPRGTASAMYAATAALRLQGEQKKDAWLLRTLKQYNIIPTEGQSIQAAALSSAATLRPEEHAELQSRIERIQKSVTIETNREIRQALLSQGVNWNPSSQTIEEAIENQTRPWNPEEIALVQAEVMRLRRPPTPRSEKAIKEYLAQRSIFMPSGATVEQVVAAEKKELYLQKEGFIDAAGKVTAQAVEHMLVSLQVLTRTIFAPTPIATVPSDAVAVPVLQGENTAPATLNMEQATSLHEGLSTFTRRFERVLDNNPSNGFAIAQLQAVRSVQNQIHNEKARTDRILASFVTPLRESAEALRLQGDFSNAQRRFELALTLEPRNAFVLSRLGEIFRRQGNNAAAKSHFEQALAIEPHSAFALRGLANVLSRQGDLSNAKSRYEQALVIEPNNAFALRELASILCRQGDLSNAKSRYEQALSIEPNNALALRELASTLCQQGDLANAKSHYEQALVIEPNSGFALAGLATVLRRQGDLTNAKSRYEQALAIEPNNAFALRGLAAVLYEQGDLTNAKSRYEQALAIEPNSAFALAGLANLLREQGDLTNAKSRYEQALAIDPNDAVALRGFADVLRQQGDLANAKIRFEQALAIEPNDAFALRGLADILRQQGDFSNAKIRFEQALAIEPNSAFAVRQLADVLRQQGDLTNAKIRYEQALAIKPNNVIALRGLAAVLYQQDDLTNAKSRFEQVLVIEPNSAFALRWLADVLRKQGDLSNAKIRYEQALAIEPTDGFALSRLADVLQQQGDLTNAKSHYEQALAILPNSDFALQGLAEVLQQQGDFTNATRCYEQALVVDPNDAEVLVGLANLLKEQGDLTNAKSRYEQALAIDPNDAVALRGFAEVLQQQ